MGNDHFPKTRQGALDAQAAVLRKCGDAFCTIQFDILNQERGGPPRYLWYQLTGCDTWHLNRFKGRFHAHNGGSLIVDLLDAKRNPIYRLWGGGSTVVNWDKVYYIRTCNKS